MPTAYSANDERLARVVFFCCTCVTETIYKRFSINIIFYHNSEMCSRTLSFVIPTLTVIINNQLFEMHVVSLGNRCDGSTLRL